MSVAKYKCAQDVFYILAHAGWRLCRKHRLRFEAIKPKYTEAYIDAKDGVITEIDYRPDANGRYIDYDLAVLAITQAKADILYDYGVLQTYIKDAFPKSDVATRYREAGDNLLTGAAKQGWPKLMTLLSSAVPFVEKNKAALLVNFENPSVANMPLAFFDRFVAYQDAYQALFEDVHENNDSGKQQTNEKIDDCNTAYLELIDMLDDAESIFAKEPDLVAEFSYTALKKKAQSTKQAALKGRVVDSVTGKTVANAAVQIDNTAKSTLSDDKGRYSLSQLSASTIRVMAELDGHEKLVVEGIKIRTGVTKRLTLKLVPLPPTPTT